MPIALACLLVALLATLRDLGSLSPTALLAIFGAVCTLGAGAALVDLLGRQLRRVLPPAWGLLGGGLILFALPLAYAVFRYAGAQDSLGLTTPVSLLLFAVSLGTPFVLFGRRLGEGSLGRGVVWSAAFTTLFLLMHLATGTLFSVRPGTENLHLGLYLGSWALLPPATLLASAPDRDDTGVFWRRLLVGAAGGALGVILLEADRYLLVDLYPEVHLWLGVMGLLCASLGVRRLLSACAQQGSRLWQALHRPYALYLLCLSALLFTALFPFLGGVGLRAQLGRSPLGSSLLDALPQATAAREALAEHPALNYPRFLDQPAPTNDYNVLLITVDALRHDAMGYMPRTAKLAEESLVFERAYTQGSRTAIGMGAMMSGLYSANIDWSLWVYRKGKIFDRDRLSKQDLAALKGRFVYTTMPKLAAGRMLAERMHAQGLSTSAVAFAGGNQFFRKNLVFARGFTDFHDLTKKKWKTPSSRKVVARSLKQLKKQAEQRWFHWVHFYDPHQSRRSKKAYQRNVKHVDAAVGRLLAFLRRTDQWRRTVVVLLSDHGEAFDEHRHFGHGSSLYEEQVRIPFTLRVPGVEARRVSAPVAAIDATATVLSLVGADTSSIDGVNLLPNLEVPGSGPSRPVFTELHRYLSNKGKRTSDLKAVIFEDWKLIVDRRRGTSELFNLRTDPGEQVNLVDAEWAQYEKLRAILDSFLNRAEAQHPLPG